MILRNLRIGNRQVRGVLTKPKDNKSYSSHILREAHIAKPFAVRSGEVLFDQSGSESYILVYDRSIGKFKIFKALRCNVTISVLEPVVSIHPVSKLKTYDDPTDPKEVLACSYDVFSEVESERYLSVTKFCIAGKINPQAKVNNKGIKNLIYKNGISEFEVA